MASAAAEFHISLASRLGVGLSSKRRPTTMMICDESTERRARRVVPCLLFNSICTTSGNFEPMNLNESRPRARPLPGGHRAALLARKLSLGAAPLLASSGWNKTNANDKLRRALARAHSGLRALIWLRALAGRDRALRSAIRHRNGYAPLMERRRPCEHRTRGNPSPEVN